MNDHLYEEWDIVGIDPDGSVFKGTVLESVTQEQGNSLFLNVCWYVYNPDKVWDNKLAAITDRELYIPVVRWSQDFGENIQSYLLMKMYEVCETKRIWVLDKNA